MRSEETVEHLNVAWQYWYDSPNSVGAAKHYNQVKFNATEEELQEHKDWVDAHSGSA